MVGFHEEVLVIGRCGDDGLSIGALFGATRRGRVILLLIALLIGITAPTAAGQGTQAPSKATEDRPKVSDGPSVAGARRTRTQAERIVGAKRLLEADRRERDVLQAEQESLKTEYDESLDAFESLDAQRRRAPGQRGDASPSPGESAALDTPWQAARDRLELIIERRTADQEQLRTLNEKIGFEQEMLDELTRFGEPAESVPTSAEHPAPQAPGTAAPTGGARAAGEEEPLADAARLDAVLDAARKEQALKRAALRAAEDRLARLDRRIDIMERDLTNSRLLLEVARRQIDADASAKGSPEDAPASGAPIAPGGTAHETIDQARERADRENERVVQSESILERLKRAQAAALENVRTAKAEDSSASNKVLFYQSPLAPSRLRWWATVKGPRVLAVLLGMAVLWWLAGVVAQRVVATAVRRGRHGTEAEREGRAETIRRAFHSGASAAIVVLGILAALHQAGIDVTVLLGGTAVVGAAIAFGSQNMVRDYFGGFMILVENQYSVGNVIRVGDITGTVEGLTLRVTSVRDLEGVLHFIPHSQVVRVSNFTYGWSRLVMDVRVTPAEDVDRVIGVLGEICRDLARDSEWGPQLIGDCEVLGVNELAGTATVIRLLVKTQPLRRWNVKRELLRRIKKAFDGASIKMA